MKTVKRQRVRARLSAFAKGMDRQQRRQLILALMEKVHAERRRNRVIGGGD